MHISNILNLRRIINSSYHPFRVIPKQAIWPKRERLKRFTAWQYSRAQLTVRGGYQKLNKIFIYMDMQRKDEPRLERYYAEERLKAALEEHNAEYQIFKNMMDKSHILLDKRILSQLAIYEPRTFKCIVDLTQKMALWDGKQITLKADDLAHIQIDSTLFGEPFPYTRLYPSGSAENHLNVPRRLKVEEY